MSRCSANSNWVRRLSKNWNRLIEDPAQTDVAGFRQIAVVKARQFAPVQIIAWRKLAMTDLRA